MSEVMPEPTERKWKEIAEDFWTHWNFPNCIGALD
ncbi:protein ALP1-like, partial [Aphis craccivora]